MQNCPDFNDVVMGCLGEERYAMDIKNTIENEVSGAERAFYGLSDTAFVCCQIDGAEDGESAFKECKRIELRDSRMALRYPLWHVDNAVVSNSRFEATCRAPMWYSNGLRLLDCVINGVKAVRECSDVTMENCCAVSVEFGWKTRGFTATNTSIEGEYLFLDSENIVLDNVKIRGKYTFQYVKNAVIRNSILDTKDAFWHSENVTVYDSVVSGEYLGWYSKGLRLVRCKISGTQPLCYADGLVLEDCTTEGCDLSFEKSELDATVLGGIHSIKNPKCGRITADSVGEVISEEGRERRTLLTLSELERAEKFI